MKILKTTEGIIIQRQDQYFLSKETGWDKFVNRSQLYQQVINEFLGLKPDAALSDWVSKNLFTRPVCYQGMPDDLLPAKLKNENP